MKNRNLKVVAQSGYKYRETPTITLKGLWVSEAGFQIGDYVSVRCEDGRLIIEPDEERVKVIEAEKIFMSRELKNLQKRSYYDTKSGRSSIGGFAVQVDVSGSNS